MQIKDLGVVDYADTIAKMQIFTATRDVETEDEIWLLEHPAVFTQGINGHASHILNAGNIPVVQADRGGQVTYHATGQLIAYVLVDLKRLGIGVRQMVSVLENTVIAMLASHNINAEAHVDAPGVYIGNAKVAALGLRVKRGACYHGVSVNIDMDLSPFKQINPCGYAGQAVIDFRRLGVPYHMSDNKQLLVTQLQIELAAMVRKIG